MLTLSPVAELGNEPILSNMHSGPWWIADSYDRLHLAQAAENHEWKTFC